MNIIRSDGHLSMKWFVLFALAPALPVIPIIGYMEYMINYDQEVLVFKQECENSGGRFVFDIPKILECRESQFKPYVGEMQLPDLITTDSRSDK